MAVEDSIIKTLSYRDIFDYPLTEEELINFLVEQSARPVEVGRTLARLVAEGKVGEKDGFYFLRGRGELPEIRDKREEISEVKYARAYRLAGFLRFSPWVRAVFITGALAVGNTRPEDDLDFLVITRKGRVWLVRFLAFVFFTLLGVRRKPEMKEAPDRVCLNMFLSETALRIPEGERNLFTAHEVALARPLWARDYLHRRFLGENPWVRRYLPNLEIPEVGDRKPEVKDRRSLLAVPRSLVTSFWTFLDHLLHKLQLGYMRKRRTREIVERDRILFHPVDLSREVLGAYKVRLYSVTHAHPASQDRERP